MATMLVILVLEVIILGGLTGYLQVRYAQANYPVSSRWYWVLFISGFITGATCIGTFLYQEATSLDELLLFSISAGVVGGLFARFLSPYQMQYIYPKRTDRAE
jgi:fluoride ion exporter CrcB/FEX